jgi:hypothetical protein
MSIRKFERRYCPTDSTPFKTLANLGFVLQEASRLDDDYRVPNVVGSTWVPIIVRMAEYKAMETRENPTGMMFGPVVKIGDECSPEITMFGRAYSAGLTIDRTIGAGVDSWKNPDRWIYTVLPGDTDAPGEDASYYVCDKCQKQLYLDEAGRRNNNSACLVDGELACRDCDFVGLVYDHEGAEQINRAFKLAAFIGVPCRQRLERHLESLKQGFSYGRPCQTRLYREDKFSFGWGTRVFCEDGTTRQGMNGGLIQHGPHCMIGDDGSYSFSVYDYSLKAERAATTDEIGNISWSIHT